MAGKAIIDYICKANDSDISYFTEAKKPSILPPNFLIEMGANCKIKFQEFLAGTEL